MSTNKTNLLKGSILAFVFLATPLASLPAKSSIAPYVPLMLTDSFNVNADDFITCYLTDNDAKYIEKQAQVDKLEVKQFEAKNDLLRSMVFTFLILALVFSLLVALYLSIGLTDIFLLLPLLVFAVLAFIQTNSYLSKTNTIEQDIENIVKQQAKHKTPSDEILYRCLPHPYHGNENKTTLKETTKSDSYYTVNEKAKPEKTK